MGFLILIFSFFKINLFSKSFCRYICKIQNKKMYQFICNMMMCMMGRNSAACPIA